MRVVDEYVRDAAQEQRLEVGKAARPEDDHVCAEALSLVDDRLCLLPRTGRLESRLLR